MKTKVLSHEEEKELFSKLSELRKITITKIQNNPHSLQEFTKNIVEHIAKASSKNFTRDHYLCKALEKYYEKYRKIYFTYQTSKSLHFHYLMQDYQKKIGYVLLKYQPKFVFIKKHIKVYDNKLYNDIVYIEKKIADNNMGLVYTTVSKCKSKCEGYTNIPQEELINQGILGLYRAIDRFDVSKGFKFSTFAIPHIYESISTFIKEENTTNIYCCVSLNEHFTEDDDANEKIDLIPSTSSFEKSVEEKFSEERLIAILGEYTANILIHILQGYSFDAIAKKFKLKRKEVAESIERTLIVLRNQNQELFEEVKELIYEHF